ncbi:unnamed protein product [Arabidopsis halleri]
MFGCRSVRDDLRHRQPTTLRINNVFHYSYWDYCGLCLFLDDFKRPNVSRFHENVVSF